MEDAKDRISQLPDSVIHEILNLLPPKDAARTSSLSRQWRRLWSTFPAVVFDLFCYPKETKFDGILDMADRCITSRLHHCQHLDAVNIRLICSPLRSHLPRLTSAADRWLSTAAARNIRGLDLCFNNKYLVPESLLVLESLTALSLAGCKLDGDGDARLPRLRKLHLERVDVGKEEIVEKLLTNSSNFIEDLAILSCERLKSLKLGPKLLRLNRVLIKCSTASPKSIAVELPNLDSLSITGWCLLEVNLSGCMAIRSLKLHNTKIMDSSIPEIISHLPSVEVLELLHCFPIPSQLKISNPNIRRLALHQLGLDLMIQTPNLRSIDIRLRLQPDDAACLDRLVKSLAAFTPSMDLKLAIIISECLIIHEKLSDVPLPLFFELREIFDVKLRITTADYAEILDDERKRMNLESISLFLQARTREGPSSLVDMFANLPRIRTLKSYLNEYPNGTYYITTLRLC